MDTVSDVLQGKTILITGGGGYLGSKLLARILSPGSKFYLLDRAFNQESTDISGRNDNVILLQSDISDKETLQRTLDGIYPDFIFHFAALLDRTRDFGIFQQLQQVNVNGTHHLLEVLQNVPYQGFYFSSSSEVYGSTNNPPFSENQLPEPPSPYSLTKLMAEALIRSFSELHQKPYTILRIFNFFGPGMPVNTFLPELLQACFEGNPFTMTQGAQKRDYLFLDDLLYYILELVGNKAADRQVINVCSGKSFPMKEIAGYTEKKCGNGFRIRYDLPYRDNELWDNCGSNERLLSMVEPVNLKSPMEWIGEIL